MPLAKIILIVLGAINLLAFLIILADKIRSAAQSQHRISEGKLFFLAAIGGSLGVYIGMFATRHKTRKWYFLLGVPLLLIENLALAYAWYLIAVDPNSFWRPLQNLLK